MAITLAGSGTITQATTTTAVVNPASLLGHTPAAGNLVVVQLDRSGNNAADTEPSGDWDMTFAVPSVATAVGHSGIYWRQFTGSESSSYTWSFGSSNRKVVILEFHDSVAGSTWTLDLGGAANFSTGDNTSSNGFVLSAGAVGADTTNEVAVASLVLSGSTGTVNPTISGFTVPFGTNTTQIEGYQISPSTSPFSITYGWTTARTKAVAGVVLFESTPPPASNTNMLLMF